MATVGSLFINVKARTASFNKKMKGVRATIGRLGTGLAQAGKKVALFGTALAGIALGALTALTLKGLAAVDSMAKLAQSVGTTVDSIQALRHIAVIGGTSIETMDKSILKMTKNIGEAAQGYSEATESLEILGLKATDLERMRPEDAFGAIADAMNNLSTQARKADVAQSLFGRGGLQLLPVLQGGSKAVGKMTGMIKKFGLEIGDNQARMVERANDAWADTKFIFSGLGNLLAVNIAPTLEAINKIIQDMVIRAGGMAGISDALVTAFEGVGVGILSMLGKINTAWANVEAGIISGAGSIAKALGSLFGGNLELIGEQLQKDAKEILLGALDFEDFVKNIERRFLEIRRKLDATEWEKILGGLTGDGELELTAPTLKGVVDNLQTAIGAFKVESNVTERQQAAMISIETKQLAALNSIKTAVTSGSGGGALT